MPTEQKQVPQKDTRGQQIEGILDHNMLTTSDKISYTRKVQLQQPKAIF